MARRARDAADGVDVCLDALELDPIKKVGRLFHRRSRSQSALSFAYSSEWLASRDAFLLDPRLELYAGEQFAAQGAPTFDVFLDSAPGRWGRGLLDRARRLPRATSGAPFERWPIGIICSESTMNAALGL